MCICIYRYSTWCPGNKIGQTNESWSRTFANWFTGFASLYGTMRTNGLSLTRNLRCSSWCSWSLMKLSKFSSFWNMIWFLSQISTALYCGKLQSKTAHEWVLHDLCLLPLLQSRCFSWYLTIFDPPNIHALSIFIMLYPSQWCQSIINVVYKGSLLNLFPDLGVPPHQVMPLMMPGATRYRHPNSMNFPWSVLHWWTAVVAGRQAVHVCLCYIGTCTVCIYWSGLLWLAACRSSDSKFRCRSSLQLLAHLTHGRHAKKRTGGPIYQEWAAHDSQTYADCTSNFTGEPAAITCLHCEPH